MMNSCQLMSSSIYLRSQEIFQSTKFEAQRCLISHNWWRSTLMQILNRFEPKKILMEMIPFIVSYMYLFWTLYSRTYRVPVCSINQVRVRLKRTRLLEFKCHAQLEIVNAAVRYGRLGIAALKIGGHCCTDIWLTICSTDHILGNFPHLGAVKEPFHHTHSLLPFCSVWSGQYKIW